MRAVLATVFVAVALLAGAFASTELNVEERCTLYFDDCNACLADSQCGWCSEYCTAKSSGLCDAGLTTDAEKCPADAPLVHSKRQATDCSLLTCSACLANDACVLCSTLDSTGAQVGTTCLSNSSAALCDNEYATTGTTEQIGNSCPIPTGITLVFVLVVSGNVDSGFFQIQFSFSFNTFTNDPIKVITSIDVIVTSNRPVAGKRSLDSRQAGNTEIKFFVQSPRPEYPISEINKDVSAFLETNSIAGINIISAETEVIGGTGSTGSNADHELSDGQLAGIIIGCIVGAALITALILYFLVVRKHKSYPAPFRSPAASFRP